MIFFGGAKGIRRKRTLDASVIAKKVNLFTFRSVSPQGFARHRRGTNFSKFAQSPWK